MTTRELFYAVRASFRAQAFAAFAEGGSEGLVAMVRRFRACAEAVHPGIEDLAWASRNYGPRQPSLEERLQEFKKTKRNIEFVERRCRERRLQDMIEYGYACDCDDDIPF